jgi:hypothetical protein
MTVLVQNGRLAAQFQNQRVVELRAPDGDGRWADRLDSSRALSFEESAGAIVAMSVHQAGRPTLRLLPESGKAGAPPALPSVAEILALRRLIQPDALRSIRTSGRVRFPQSAVDGRYQALSAGDDRIRVDISLGQFGDIAVVVDGDRGWRASNLDHAPFLELDGVMLAQARHGHPSVLFGDWRRYFDEVRVVRAGDRAGRRVYYMRLSSKDLPPVSLAIDAETGDIVESQQTVVIPNVASLPMTTTYEDYRDVEGARLPFRSVESNEQTGRTIYEVERVEVNVAVKPDAFARPSDTGAR